MASGVSIVIPTWNGLELLKRFLPSVLSAALHYSETTHAPTEIIIVDDASSDETIAWLVEQGFEEKTENGPLLVEAETNPVDAEWQALQSQARRANGARSSGNNATGASLPNEAVYDESPTIQLGFLRNEINRGFGETCNRGIAVAAFPLIFLLNNDVEVAADAIAPLVENFADDAVFAAHCRVFELDSKRECGTGKLGSFARGFIRVHRSYAAFRPRTASQTSPRNPEQRQPQGAAIESRGFPNTPLYSMFAGGGSAMFDREKFLAMGGFEPLLSPFYWEDVELSYRAWKRGFKVLYEPRSIAHHRVSSTIGKLERRHVRLIEQRNRIAYHWIHLHDTGLLASHIAWVTLLAFTAPLRFKPVFLFAVIAALRMLPQLKQRRHEEKQIAQRSDRDLFKLFAEFEKLGNVHVYANDAELAQINAQAKQL